MFKRKLTQASVAHVESCTAFYLEYPGSTWMHVREGGCHLLLLH